MKKILLFIFLCYVFQVTGAKAFFQNEISFFDVDSSLSKKTIEHNIGFELGGTFVLYSLFYDITFKLKNNNFIGIGCTTPIYVPLNYGWGYGFKFFYGFGKSKSSKISLTYGNIVNIRSIKGEFDNLSPWDRPIKFYHVFSLYSGQYFNLKDSKFSLFYNLGGNFYKYKSLTYNNEIKKRSELFPFVSFGFQYKIK